MSTYLRAYPGHVWHIYRGVYDLRAGHITPIAACGRAMRGISVDVLDDGTVPEPVCATCSRLAARR